MISSTVSGITLSYRDRKPTAYFGELPKKTGRLQERLDVYWIVHNFVRVHFTTRQVPAVALGILDRGFGLHELFLIQKAA